MASTAPEQRPPLRLVVCGSVDDGKSTLIGRLLHATGSVPLDEWETLEAASARQGDAGGVDFSLLTDGLIAEREQGITIDVAYRSLTTDRRRIIIADAPGHEQYTRNMVTAASTAELALLLVDARKGVLTQTRRHAVIAHLLGIRQFALAVNKMDLVDYGEERFRAIVEELGGWLAELGSASLTAMPVSALNGDNVVEPSARMAWYGGASLLQHLETVAVECEADAAGPLRFPVQWVNRQVEGRGYAGTVSRGTVRAGDAVRILPAGTCTHVDRIVTADGDREEAAAGLAVTLTLRDPVDCARGDVIAAANAPPEVADQFEATIVWVAEEPMLPGRGYRLKLATTEAVAQVQSPKYRLDPDRMEHLAARTLELNDIGVANISLDRAIAFEPYRTSRALGGFILIDRVSQATLAAGMIHFALRRAHNIHPQALDVGREDRAAMKGQRGLVIWLTGLSGAGKSTLANLIDRRLTQLGRHTMLLDGDNLRHGLNRDLGFTDVDRVENVRRAGEVARLMADAGLLVIAAFISPFRQERDLVRAMLPPGDFKEIHVDVPLAVAEARDPKGLYRKARAGELSNFTGIDSPYQPPVAPELRIDSSETSPEEAADLIVRRVLEWI